MTASARLLSMSRHSFQRQLFPIHLSTGAPPLDNEQWKISAD